MVYTHDDYTIGWISTLPVELKAAIELLDEKHDDLQAIDENIYTLGRINGHNVVIVNLPHDDIGTSAAAQATADLKRSFPNVRFTLLVGIGGGVPGADVRLGDVVVSAPGKGSGGVIQYDRGTNLQGEEDLVQKGFLRGPPRVVRHAITKIRAMKGDITTSCHDRPTTDELYEPGYIHQNGANCSACDKSRILERAPRDGKVHYGLIGSGNQVIKNSEFRDKLHKKYGIICFEMEAAGLMGAFDCLVIRGISDYCDTHKNDHWQPYASAVAAAYAKDLLSVIPMVTIVRKKTDFDKEQARILKALYTCPYEERKNRNVERVKGTCRWVTRHSLFRQWLQSNSGILWLSGDPGCGKSVLARYLVDEYLHVAHTSTSQTICYFFFNDDFDDQKTSKEAMRALLRQLYIQKHSLLTPKVLNIFETDGEILFESFSNLWSMFLEACADPNAGEVICVLDALDECTQDDAKELVRAICEQYQYHPQMNLKILVTSRSYSYIHDAFWSLKDQPKMIYLSGEEASVSEIISKEIDLVIEHRLGDLAARKNLNREELDILRKSFMAVPQLTYLWVHLIFSHLQNRLGVTSVKLEDLVEQLPTTLDEVYEKILQRSTDYIAAKRVLQVLLVAYRPLTLNDIAILLTLDDNDTKESTFLARVDSDTYWDNKIRNICGLFVVVVDSRVYLLHQTARQFLLDMNLLEQPLRSVVSINEQPVSDTYTLKWKASLKLKDGHGIMAESCVRYLLLGHKHCNEMQCLEPHGVMTFKTYCYTHWASHYQECNPAMDAPTTISAERLCWRLQNRARCHAHELERNGIYCNSKSSLGLAAALGLSGVLESRLLSLNLGYYKMFREIRYAVESDHVIAIQILLKQWPKWLTRQAWLVELVFGDFSPLHQAVALKKVQLVKLLLSHGADTNIKDWSGRTPLHIAAQSAKELKPYTNRQVDTDIIEFLLTYGADCNLRDLRGWTAAASFVMSACEEGEDSDIVRKVFSLLAIQQENVDRLWQYDLWPHKLEEGLLRIIYNGNSKLWAVSMLGGAALAKHIRCIDALLQIGANPNTCDNRGHGLLHCAVLGGDISIVEHVLSLEFSVDDKNSQGYTPLMLAAMLGLIEISELLIRAGADVVEAAKVGMTPLMHAAIRDSNDNALLDLYRKAAAELDTAGGKAAFMHGVGNHWHPEIKYLLGIGMGISSDIPATHTLYCFLEAHDPSDWLKIQRRGLDLPRYELRPMIRKVKRCIKIATSSREWPASRIIWSIIFHFYRFWVVVWDVFTIGSTLLIERLGLDSRAIPKIVSYNYVFSFWHVVFAILASFREAVHTIFVATALFVAFLIVYLSRLMDLLIINLPSWISWLSRWIMGLFAWLRMKSSLILRSARKARSAKHSGVHEEKKIVKARQKRIDASEHDQHKTIRRLHIERMIFFMVVLFLVIQPIASFIIPLFR